MPEFGVEGRDGCGVPAPGGLGVFRDRPAKAARAASSAGSCEPLGGEHAVSAWWPHLRCWMQLPPGQHSSAENHPVHSASCATCLQPRSQHLLSCACCCCCSSCSFGTGLGSATGQRDGLDQGGSLRGVARAACADALLHPAEGEFGRLQLLLDLHTIPSGKSQHRMHCPGWSTPCKHLGTHHRLGSSK